MSHQRLKHFLEVTLPFIVSLPAPLVLKGTGELMILLNELWSKLLKNSCQIIFTEFCKHYWLGKVQPVVLKNLSHDPRGLLMSLRGANVDFVKGPTSADPGFTENA